MSYWLFAVRFTQIVQAVHEIWCTQDSTQWPAVTLTFDPQNLIRSSVGGSECSPSVLSKLCKPFTIYRGNNSSPDDWTDGWTYAIMGNPKNIMPLPTLLGG